MLMGGLVTSAFRVDSPALPWAIFSAMILGMGHQSGALLGLVTLNFEDYWNWGP